MIQKISDYSPAILRWGLASVFLWFGTNQVLFTSQWTSWLPGWAYDLPLSPDALVTMNGSFEILVGIMLLLGLFTRLSSLVLGLHMIMIITGIGYNDVAVRDFGIMIALFSVSLRGYDEFSVDMMVKDSRLLRKLKLGWLI